MTGGAPVRRNDPCPCGSGRRYKECHGRLAADAPPAPDPVARALQLHQQGRIAEAQAIYRDVLAREPRHPVATHYLGMATWQLGDPAEGERLMRLSLMHDASIPDFHNNLGLLLRDTHRAEEAVHAYRRALEVDPDWFEAYNNLGLALEDAGRFDDALEAYRTALAREPRFAAARQNMARVLLAAGRFAEGWQAYRWRLVAQGLAREAPDPAAQTLPASLEGRRFELVGEQGIGDVLFFLRFAPELARRGARLAFRGDARLHGLLSRTGVFTELRPASAQRAAGEEPVFIGDLPWLLEMSEPRGFPPPLRLAPLAERAAAWRSRLEALGPAPRIALTWRAGIPPVGPATTQLKEVPAAILARMLHDRSATWLSVQRNPRSGETGTLAHALGAPVHDLSATNDDLEEMLALMSVADGYVGVSNANAHLRAGVEKPMTVLVPFPPEWRYGGTEPRSPWFPHARLVRQACGGAWETLPP